MSLIASLGLDNVSSDVNDLPTGKYDGKIVKSEFVIVKEKKQVSHVLTYKVTEGEQTGAEKQHWYNLYNEIDDGNGNVPEKPEGIKAAKPMMTEKNKQWYKKTLRELTGCSEEEASKVTPDQLVGIDVTFGVAERNGYKNVNFVERRASAPTGPVEGQGFATSF